MKMLTLGTARPTPVPDTALKIKTIVELPTWREIPRQRKAVRKRRPEEMMVIFRPSLLRKKKERRLPVMAPIGGAATTQEIMFSLSSSSTSSWSSVMLGTAVEAQALTSPTQR